MTNSNQSTSKRQKISTNEEFYQSAKSSCSVKTLKKRLPISLWLPNYSFASLIQDAIAGITVGLTAIPQGIAYAVIAGLSPEYGLYAGLTGGFVYLIFGSTKDITIGPTMVISALTAKYVAENSGDTVVLAAFLSGVFIMCIAILQLGFLVEFFSGPVISGFTTAAAIQTAMAQLKAIFGMTSPSGNYFAESLFFFIKNCHTAKLWDPMLGILTILILAFLKRFGEGCSRTDNFGRQIKWFICLARNAIVVIFGILVAYIVKISTNGSEPLLLTGDIEGGLPKFSLPPFSTSVGNTTLNFVDMVSTLGLKSIVIPIVSILECVAIAKAFARGVKVDATQEMIALGLCNIVGSFFSSMPVTASFTRSALNNSSGSKTPAGGIFTGLILVLALWLLTSTFYFIPKTSLAGLIMTAMYWLVDFNLFGRLWRSSKKEFCVLILTILISLFLGLEYGIIAGAASEAVLLLYTTARPEIKLKPLTFNSNEVLVITLTESVSYCGAEYVRSAILEASRQSDCMIVLDGTNLKNIDMTVASNLIAVVKDLNSNSKDIIFMNFKPRLQKMCLDLNPKIYDKFVVVNNLEECLAQSKTDC